MMESVVGAFYPDAGILTFVDANEAHEELLRQPPDLFTTDVCHPPPYGDELLQRLSAQQVDYPIFVMSAFVTTPEMLRPGSLGPGLNVTFLPKPFPVEEFVRLLQQHVDPRLIA